MINGYWTLDSESISFKPGYEYTIGISKILKKILNLDDSCLVDEEVKVKNYDYLKCVEMYTRDQLLKNLMEKSQKLCWIPQADFFISAFNSTNIEACKTIDEMKVMKTELQNVMEFSSSLTPLSTFNFSTFSLFKSSFSIFDLVSKFSSFFC